VIHSWKQTTSSTTCRQWANTLVSIYKYTTGNISLRKQKIASSPSKSRLAIKSNVILSSHKANSQCVTSCHEWLITVKTKSCYFLFLQKNHLIHIVQCGRCWGFILRVQLLLCSAQTWAWFSLQLGSKHKSPNITSTNTTQVQGLNIQLHLSYNFGCVGFYMPQNSLASACAFVYVSVAIENRS